ncbi:hypothetical protein FACS189490_11450 [Clostridia bacterium]|nr:hypothetical protein FACS189490_11450 [Clostridia bacterium]
MNDSVIIIAIVLMLHSVYVLIKLVSIAGELSDVDQLTDDCYLCLKRTFKFELWFGVILLLAKWIVG